MKIFFYAIVITLSCNLFAASYTDGLNASHKGNYKKALKIFSETCKNKDSYGCLGLGSLYLEGLGAKKNIKQAETFFLKSCDLGNKQGCLSVGLLSMQNAKTKLDKTMALRYFERSCKLGDSNGCNNIAIMYRKGEGVNEDYKQAIHYYINACDLGNANACFDSGLIYGQGLGSISTDYKKAKNFFHLACDGGIDLGCKNYQVAMKNAPQSQAEKGFKIGVLYPLDTLEIIIKDSPKKLKVTIALELSSEQLASRIESKNVQIRNIINNIISSKTEKELNSKNGKMKVNKQILSFLNNILENGEIYNIYFTEYTLITY